MSSETNDEAAAETPQSSDWVDYQQTEIDKAIEKLEERHQHITSEIPGGLLYGEYMQERQHNQFRAYLQGYADGLQFAIDTADGIDNLVQYAVESGQENGDQQ